MQEENDVMIPVVLYFCMKRYHGDIPDISDCFSGHHCYKETMHEKFRLWCDLNDIDLSSSAASSEEIISALEKYPTLVAFHSYSFLFKGYHDLTHGVIDDEQFFLLGDISSDAPIFSPGTSGLESVFVIEETVQRSTLYITEGGARAYYVSKVSEEGAHRLQEKMKAHESHLLVI